MGWMQYVYKVYCTVSVFLVIVIYCHLVVIHIITYWMLLNVIITVIEKLFICF